MSSDDSLLPVRAINAFTFCPRLFWLEHVEGVFEENAHTLEGSSVHRRVDQPGGSMSPPEKTETEDVSKNTTVSPDESQEAETPWHTRSLWLSDDSLGVSGKIDLVEEGEAGFVMPVDTKKGRPTDDNELWPADRVQLTLQALLLRSQGYRVERVAVWYHSARKRVVQDLTPDMEQEARLAVEKARVCAGMKTAPPPLEDSPQCRGCSLHAVCLPDEINALLTLSQTHKVEENQVIRRIVPVSDDVLPLYVQENGTRVGLSQGCLTIQPRDPDGEKVKAQKVGLMQISELNLFGGVQITTQAVQSCLQAGVPIHFFSTGGWFYGRAVGMDNRQVHVRMAQFSAHQTPQAFSIARQLVADKISNCRVMLRRNADQIEGSDVEITVLKRMITQAEEADSVESLLGIEGDSARRYWSVFSSLLARDHEEFRMNGRNRRPPRDPSNALLSFGYALLVKDCTLALHGAGLDPFLGMYHTPHHGRPALALDLMEPFRPLIVDSVVLQMIRRGEVKPDDFIQTGQAVAFKSGARKALIRAYERRMDEQIAHPVFGYRISYRQILSVQARLLARAFLGEIPNIPAFRTR